MKTIFSKYLFVLAATVLAAGTKAQVDRSKAPLPGPAPEIQIGDYKLFELENGLKVIVVENHKLPRVSYSINLVNDPVLEGKKAGYAGMAGDLMATGTTTRSKAQIDETIDFIGASLSTSSGGVFASCLKKHSDKLLEVMSDVVLNPAFPQEELDKARKKAISGLASARTNPNALSDKITAVMNYTVDHPYGEFETEETLNAITRDDLVSFHELSYVPNKAYLVIVGDITENEAKQQAMKYFGSWKRGKGYKYTPKKVSAPQNRQVVFVPLPGAVQSVIDITYPVDLKPGTQEAITASVLNNILGGSGFSTRLMQNLREAKAYTYGAYSSLSPDEWIGAFSASCSVRNEVTDSAAFEILAEMRKLIEEPVHDTTLQTVKNIMTGNFARSLERPQTIANFAFNIERYGLPKDYYATYLQRLNAITKEDINLAARKFLRPENCYVTVVGNRTVAQNLSRLAASGQVLLRNADGSVFKDIKPAPAGVTAQSVLRNHISALGGEKKLAKVKAMEQAGSMAFGPMKVNMVLRMKDQKKMSLTMSAQGAEMVKQVYDGANASFVQMGQKVNPDDEEVLAMRMQADLTAELHLERYGITPELKGVDQLENGEEVYVIELKMPSGKVNTEYYSTKTGLKAKKVEPSKQGEKEGIAETYYLEYGDVNGFKYPSRVKQVADGHEMEISFSAPNLKAKLKDTDFTVTK